MCKCAGSLTGRDHCLLGEDYSDELDNGAGVCVYILICARLWGFIMRSLNLPNDELCRGSVGVCVVWSQYQGDAHSHCACTSIVNNMQITVFCMCILSRYLNSVQLIVK